MNLSDPGHADSLVNQQAASGSLPRRLGVTALVLIIVAFNAPIATMAGFAQLVVGFGNGIGAPLSFLIAGAILLIFSAGFIEMSRFIDNPGAFYRFIVIGLGRPAGLAGAFLATAAYLLLCAGSYPYLGLVAVDFMTRLTGGPVLSWETWTAIFMLVLTIIGLLRADLSMRFLGYLVLFEILMIGIWQIAVILQGGPEGYSGSSFTPTGFAQGSPGLGIVFAMLCMVGIEAAPCFSSEAKNPQKTVGRATRLAVVFMAGFNCLGTWAYIVTQGGSKAVTSASTNPVGSFFTSLQHYLGGFFVNVFALTLVTSMILAINAIQGSAARYLFSLGRDKVLPECLGRVHRRLQSPHVAVMAVAVVNVVVLIAIVICRVEPVIAYAALTGIGIYFLLPLLIATSAAIITFYHANRGLQTSRWARLVAPGLSVLVLSVLFGLTSLNLKVLVGNQTVVLIAMLAVVAIPAAGWLLALNCRKKRPAVYAVIGRH